MSSAGGDRKPALPWTTSLTVSMLSFVTDTARRSNITVNRCFLRLFDLRSSPTPNPSSTTGSRSVSTSDVTVDSSRNLWFRLFVPASASSAAPGSLAVILFFHGGGFSFLSPASFAYDAVCRRIARKLPAVVASVNYRLSPEHRYPCQYDDGFSVLDFLDGDHEGVLPEAADLSRLFLAGDSAGANLAHHVAVRAARRSAPPWKRVRVEGLVSIQPFFGGEERTEAEKRLPKAPVVTVERTDWMWKAFLPEGASRDHAAANVSGPNAEDITGVTEFPRTVVVVGGLDPLQDWQRRYFQWLQRSGKEARLLEYPNMIHAFYLFPELPDSGQFLKQLRDFIYDR
ncbi:hypothetical protein TIFTF001_002583 [Ficus carica]|uniref:Alpha/beta hydrolase fold-3 domain-containing protein n=1 Tax=Ficus carica TaxID=3494 RepID=A0AA87Z5E0_FICCA|nr:hypothetical protein TIFTF001_002583 [Ficus carica]